MYAKVFDKLLKSSLMESDLATRWAWVALLLMADADDLVYGTIPSLARAANITIEQMHDAMDIFTAPDRNSTSQENEGRRIVMVAPNTWHIVNRAKYRKMSDADAMRQQTKERVRRYRDKGDKDRESCNARVTPCNADVTQSNARVTPCNAMKRHIDIDIERDISVASQPHSNSPDGEDLSGRVFEAKKGGSEPKDIPTHRIFAHWQAVMGHPGAKLDPARTAAIRRALHLGYTEADLKAAIDGCRATAHTMGDNDKGRIYDSLGLILRSADHIDRFITNAASPARPKKGDGLTGTKPRVIVEAQYEAEPRREDDEF
jgi:hypothetical protein